MATNIKSFGLERQTKKKRINQSIKVTRLSFQLVLHTAGMPS